MLEYRTIRRFIILGMLFMCSVPCLARPPENFVYVSEICKNLILEIRYYSNYNFVGDRIEGYLAPRAILSQEAAQALCKAATTLEAQGYVLKIFDAYRPQRAVDHFVRWAKTPDDIRMQAVFYPEIDKSKLFELNYIASKSGHSRGSTVDVTLVDKLSGQEIDMGSTFDFFSVRSHHGAQEITEKQSDNREKLKIAMIKAGFKPYVEEWWHYTLVHEPYPNTYFNFPIE